MHTIFAFLVFLKFARNVAFGQSNDSFALPQPVICPDIEVRCGNHFCGPCTYCADETTGLCCAFTPVHQVDVGGICCLEGEQYCGGSCCSGFCWVTFEPVERDVKVPPQVRERQLGNVSDDLLPAHPREICIPLGLP